MGSVAAVAQQGQQSVAPFAYGTRPILIPLTQFTYAASTTVNYLVPKNGFLSAFYFRFLGTVTVGTAATTVRTPQLQNIIKNYQLTANYGYQYRNIDGDTLYMLNEVRAPYLANAVTGSPNFQTYAPGTASGQTVQFTLRDNIGQNEGLNFDKFLLSAQTLDSDLILTLTFGAITDIIGVGTPGQAAGNEVISSVTGTLYVDATYFSVPDTSEYALPDLSFVQQISTDSSFTAPVAGDNTINLTPVQGPRYMQIFVKGFINGGNDPVSSATVFTRFQLKANNQENLFDERADRVIQRQYEFFGKALPPGWFCFNFIDDLGISEMLGPIGRNIISTEAFATLWLIVSIASGTTIGTSPLLKVVKRVVAPIQG